MNKDKDVILFFMQCVFSNTTYQKLVMKFSNDVYNKTHERNGKKTTKAY